MAQFGDDSRDSWRNVIILAKSYITFIDGGLAKSFGVLFPDMVRRYGTDQKTIAFICSLPATLMYLSGPIVSIIYGKVTRSHRRWIAMLGGLFYSLSMILVMLANDNVVIFGTLMAVAGVASSFAHLAAMLAVYEYFPASFIATNTLTLFGGTAGAFILPVIIERSLEAYGLAGAFMIMGGIGLNTLPCGAALRIRSDYQRVDKDDLSSRSCLDVDSINMSQQDEPPIDGENLSTDSSYVQNSTASDSNSQPAASLTGRFLKLIKSSFLVREPLYTLIIPAIFLQTYATYAWMLFIVPHAMWLGIEPARAVFISSIAAVSGVFGRICYLVLLRRGFSCVLIFSVACCVCACSFFIDAAGSTYAFQAFVASVQGFTMFVTDCIPHALMRLSVQKNCNVDSAIAANSLIIGIALPVGDALSGHIYDVTSSYTVVYLFLGGVLFLVIFDMLLFIATNKYLGRTEGQEKSNK